MLKVMIVAKKNAKYVQNIKPLNLPTALIQPLLLLLQNVKTTYISHQ